MREPASTPAATHNTATPQHHNTSNVAIPCYDVSAEHRGASGAPPLPPASAMLTGTAASRLRRPPHAFRGCGSARARAHACTRQHAYASIHTPVCIKAHRAPIHTRAYHCRTRTSTCMHTCPLTVQPSRRRERARALVAPAPTPSSHNSNPHIPDAHGHLAQPPPSHKLQDRLGGSAPVRHPALPPTCSRAPYAVWCHPSPRRASPYRHRAAEDASARA